MSGEMPAFFARLNISKSDERERERMNESSHKFPFFVKMKPYFFITHSISEWVSDKLDNQ